MKKVVRLGTVGFDDVFCKIEITNGNLSISGVEGPLKNGNCSGSCGQIMMHLKAESVKPAPGWNTALIQRFLEVWERWHLNDMRAGCEHQRRDWNPSEMLTIYHFRLSERVEASIRECETAAVNCIAAGQTYKPTKEDTRLANLARRITHDSADLPPELIGDYVPNMPVYPGDTYNKAKDEKRAGWVKPSEHPKGILGKPCPVCGYKYGSAWLREELPAEVVEFLTSLPDTDKTPAWV